MSELQRLIEEQQLDMKRGPVQPPEAGTIPLGRAEMFLSNSGVRRQSWRTRMYPECALHGRAFMKLDGRYMAYCTECHRESVKAWRALNKDTARYREVKRAQNERYYQRHQDEINRKRREKYAADPEYRQAALERKRRSRAKAR